MITTSCPSHYQLSDPQHDASLRRIALVAIVAFSLVATVFSTVCNTLHAANPLTQQDKFAQRLKESHSGLVDGQSLRQAIEMVAKGQGQPQHHINTWLDRKVDPDVPVSPITLGPTRYASLCSIAETARCVCYPIDNCVLIGRPAWVAQLSRQLYLGSENSSRSTGQDRSRIDLQWPMLTTPTEALQMVSGHLGKTTRTTPRRSADSILPAPPTVQLPHDLWPAVDWRDISPRLAQRLIVGQFADVPDPSRVNDPFGRSYRWPYTKNWLDPLLQIDPYIRVNASGSRTRLLGSPAAHQWFSQQVLSVADETPDQANDPASNPPGDPLERLQSNQREFTMNVQNKPAGQVIKVLLTKIGIEYEFAANANQTLQKLVSFNAVDQTPWQLVRLIADQASLKIGAANGKLRISAK